MGEGFGTRMKRLIGSAVGCRDTLEHKVYEQLWHDAVSAFARGKPDMDPCLSDRRADSRRGVTLLARPSPPVRDKVKAYLERLARVFPEQYFYRPEELHVTVLSIISGTQSWRTEIRQLASYRAIIGAVLSRQRSFRIRFRGITASPGAVMFQGFPVDDGLARIRDGLRTAFAHAGFTRLLDRRYRISTAHITGLRFRQPGVDAERLVSLLEEGRQINFGETHVTNLELIWGDWYASANIVRTLQEYRLSDI
jgi:2'-5' RNA ligase